MGLLAPAALWFAGLMAPVVLMYFLRQRRTRIVLPTTALWSRFVREQSQASRLHRFRSDPLFWLQIALMAGLIAALSRPFWRGAQAPGHATVIILDASASMQTLEHGRTRFAAAQEEIDSLLRGIGGGDRAMLVAAGPRPWVVHSMTDDVRAVRRALRALRCTDGVGNVAAAIRVAAQSAGPGAAGQIRVWTDGAGFALDGVDRLDVPVEWYHVGEEQENVGVTAFAVRRRPDSPLDFEAFAAVTNAGSQSKEVALSLTLNDQLLQFERRTLPPGTTTLITEPLLANQAGVIRLTVEPRDALPVDDVAQLVLAPRRPLRVKLVTTGNSLLERVLSLMPGVRVQVVSPRAVAVNADAVDLVVFDRWLPARWPAAPALVFGPPPHEFWPGARLRAHPTIGTWRGDHSVLRHLTFADVHVAQALVHPGGRGVTHLVSADTGGLVWTQHAAGAQRIIVGFALDASDWILRPSFPLFLANVFEEVRRSSAAEPAASARVGESVHVRAPAGVETIRVIYPDGEEGRLPVERGVASVDTTRQAGVYHFAADGWAESRVVNLLNADETRVRPEAPPGGTAADLHVAGVGMTREFWPWLLAGAILLSLLEWAMYHRRLV